MAGRPIPENLMSHRCQTVLTSILTDGKKLNVNSMNPLMMSATLPTIGPSFPQCGRELPDAVIFPLKIAGTGDILPIFRDTQISHSCLQTP